MTCRAASQAKCQSHRSHQRLTFQQWKLKVFFPLLPGPSHPLCCGIYQHCLNLAVSQHWHQAQVVFVLIHRHFWTVKRHSLRSLLNDIWTGPLPLRRLTAVWQLCVYSLGTEVESGIKPWCKCCNSNPARDHLLCLYWNSTNTGRCKVTARSL